MRGTIENSRHSVTLTFIPREKTPEKREKKFHTDDRLLSRVLLIG